jgi:twinkle protein
VWTYYSRSIHSEDPTRLTLQPGRAPCHSCGANRGLGTDEQGREYCFACGFQSHSKKESPFVVVTDTTLITDFKVKPLPERMIGAETCRRYNYAAGTYDGKPCQIANYTNELGEIVGQKIRLEPKRFVTLGKIDSLFGQHKVREGGKMIVITEGETDALAVSEVLGNRWPVVSLPHGAGTAQKYVKASLEFLEKYEKVVLCFDSDAAGRKAVEQCRGLFSPGKVRIANLSRKDPCEHLQNNERDKLVDAIWGAATWTPGGILGGAAVLAAALEKPVAAVCQWPWPVLNRLLDGLRYRELITLGAQTGIGKSTVCRELAAHFLSHGETVGYLALEESPRRTALGIYGIHCDTNLARGQEPDEAKIRAAHAAWGDHLFLFDHFGSFDPTELLSRINFMIKSLGCRIIVLDHLSILVSGLELDDERRAIDKTMTQLRELVEQTGCLLILVSHLRRTDGKPKELGEETNIHQFRGSSSITALSDIVIGFERNQQSSDESSRNLLQARLLKNRPVGPVGPADILRYDGDTGRLTVGEAPKLFKDESEF